MNTTLQASPTQSNDIIPADRRYPSPIAVERITTAAEAAVGGSAWSG